MFGTAMLDRKWHSIDSDGFHSIHHPHGLATMHLGPSILPWPEEASLPLLSPLPLVDWTRVCKVGDKRFTDVIGLTICE